MFGKAFNTAAVDEYADWILGEVKKQLPPGHSPGTKDIGARAEKLNERISLRTVDFSKTTKLNLFKKARLTARVREGMTAHGYPEPFVKSFSLDLLARIARAAQQAKKK
jgi:hypothetical protein